MHLHIYAYISGILVDRMNGITFGIQNWSDKNEKALIFPSYLESSLPSCQVS